MERPRLGEDVGGFGRFILRTQQSGQLEHGHRRDHGILQRVVGEAAQLIDGVVDVAGHGDGLGAFEVRLGHQRVVGEFLGEQLFISGACGRQDLGFLRRLGE